VTPEDVPGPCGTPAEPEVGLEAVCQRYRVPGVDEAMRDPQKMLTLLAFLAGLHGPSVSVKIEHP
jgi:hypothetical protein